MPITPAEKHAMRFVAEDAAKVAVKETLLTLGVDTDSPIEVQRDMQALREIRLLIADKEYQNDLVHLRRWRKTLEGVESKGVFALVSMLLFGALGFIFYAFKMKL